MTTAEKIERINQVLITYFKSHRSTIPVPAKDIMSDFIKASIFPADHKDGFPIRNLLRSLDARRQLHLIPFVIPERKAHNTNWFFGPAHTRSIKKQKQEIVAQVQKSAALSSVKPRSHSDECYVLDLCDEVLGTTSERQHRFPFLVGDPNSAGRCTTLPVDAWYQALNLVIEFNERQHSEPVKLFDRRMTVSGISRGEQRSIYDQRKLAELPRHGSQVVVLHYSDFRHNTRKKLRRERTNDLQVIATLLKPIFKNPGLNNADFQTRKAVPYDN